MQHIRREHPTFAAEMLAATPGETGSLLHYVRHSAQNTFGFGWLEWIVMGNLPLSFCENRLARRYTNLEPITLRRSLEAVTRSVERAIAVDLLERFGIIFDGWSHASQHFIAVLARYEVGEEVRCPLLSMAPLCVFLVGDNCTANHRLATLMDIPRIGCASHRLSRAVAAQLKEHAGDLDLVQTLMLKLRTLTQSAKLRLKTSLRPIIRQQTRWGSNFAMLNRFFELLPFLDADDEEFA
ncbi:hypothetical protein PPTG_04998 [Phytophthora nicotianae INRA-310]|uniref:Uncharacterized protein n=1 Tax=Phytophthora nicotianae (strain INRA-310) TaxID=761204 RepID=W2QVY0_PHYN3|nr:hypothetical protein PPTG_04998 [Phytophthora nicotianae INRA-310]ETN17096.1 hypothetical protein PPTG_04998 [Phytophthora nicotianae INRA-310]